MKTQISKQHSNVVAVQPLTAAHKEDCMKNAHRIHFESQSTASQTAASRGLSVHRLSTMFAVAMSIFLLGFICSAQQTATYIPQFNTTGSSTTINSIMDQPSSIQIDDHGSFNLTDWTSAFRIGGKEVLKATDYDQTGYHRSLSIGIGAGSISSTVAGTGSNTFVGDVAGSLNTNSTANTFVGQASGFNNSTGGYSTCVGTGACFYSNTTGNTMVGVYAGFNTTGGDNTFLGASAGGNTTTGSSNIYIGPSAQGAPTEKNTIRIGVQGTGWGQQSSAYMAGIVSHPTSFANPVPVVTIGADGRLGVQNITIGGGGLTGTCPTGKFATWAGPSTLGCTNLLSVSGSTLTVSGSITATSNVTGSVVMATSGFQTSGGTGISTAINLTDVNGNPCFIIFQGGIATATSCP
jgi:hypothetical protein